MVRHPIYTKKEKSLELWLTSRFIISAFAGVVMLLNCFSLCRVVLQSQIYETRDCVDKNVKGGTDHLQIDS